MSDDGKVIKRVERLANSASGAPRWHVLFEDGSAAKTKRDAQVAFGIEEYVGKPVSVVLEGGEIKAIEYAGPAPDECPAGCGRKVPVGKLMDPVCWAEVPTPIQRRVYQTWNRYRRTSRLDRETKAEARAAYHEARDAAIGSIR